jgi:isoleucyl-tRNA synthetase
MFDTAGALDFMAIAREVLDLWDRERVFERLVERNRGGPRFSFLDGPITANNPMGVHHARGRTYKDLFQRYRAMCGFDQRYQNGFDCQGLWVEVEVEKALGFDGKRDIEALGLETFARTCRDRVATFAALQTEQSRRLGQWMDWPRSYFTMSDANVEYIWHFLAECGRRGWIYVGQGVMPWCVRCGTSISQHEMLESYVETTHQAVVVALPVVGREGERLLAWTTTPWTLPANVALAVHPDREYEAVQVGDALCYVAADARAKFPALRDVRGRVRGSELVGLRYRGPFDELEVPGSVEHRVIAWDEVAEDEGTGIVHVAPGCGAEDFELGRKHGLTPIAPVDEEGRYLPGFGSLTGRSVFEATEDVVAALKAKGMLQVSARHRHRYPNCWRCGQELIFRLVDEWFIRADEVRVRALEVNADVSWHPEHMRLRMHDWLTNMGDWCVSRKRYWGLPLPFYPCGACGRLTIAGSLDELRRLAVDPATVESLPELHRPWIDEVMIRCPACGGEVRRIAEVGDCWLDAGIVPFSTLGYLEDRDEWARWFPADLVVEMAAQIRGWFYAMLFMSVTLEGRAPYRTVVAHEKVLGEDGREMHKSGGNAVWLDDALDRMGPDVVRYLFASHGSAEPIRFGYGAAREVKRRFLTFWNVYTLFVTYANADRPSLPAGADPPSGARGLEAWILSRLQGVIREVRTALDAYQPRRALSALEAFVQDDLSNWYVRRRRRQFWKGEMTDEKVEAYATLLHVLVRVCQLLAPVTPFATDHIYRNLVARRTPGAPGSVHLTPFPSPDPALEDPALETAVSAVRQVLSVGLAARNAAGVKVRQPLARAVIAAPPDSAAAVMRFASDFCEELNVLEVRGAAEGELSQKNPEQEPTGNSGTRNAADEPSQKPGMAVATEGDISVALDIEITPELRRKGTARAVVHQVQQLRKHAGLEVADRIRLSVAGDAAVLGAVDEHREYVCAETLAVALTFGDPAAGATAQDARVDGVDVRLGLERA